MTPNILVSSAVQLFSLPEVAIRVNDMVDDPTVSAPQIGDVIAADSGMTTRLLKIVNSSYYGFPSRIETISRAITIIGIKDLRDLILATAAVDVFSKVPSELLDMGSFWRHSLNCAVASRIIAKHCNMLHPERLFIAGLLHDIGKLVLCNQMPEQMRDAMLVANDDSDTAVAAEQDILGFTHAEVSSELMKVWGLPEMLHQSARWHHDASQIADTQMETQIVYLANLVTNAMEIAPDVDDLVERVDSPLWSALSIDAGPEFMRTLADETNHGFLDTCATLLPVEYRMP